MVRIPAGAEQIVEKSAYRWILLDKFKQSLIMEQRQWQCRNIALVDLLFHPEILTEHTGGRTHQKMSDVRNPITDSLVIATTFLFPIYIVPPTI